MDTFKQDIHDVSTVLGGEYMESLFVAITHFYVDLPYLVDFRLSALLCLMTDNDYSIICKNMDKYNERTSPITTKSFPGISITEDQITKYLEDPTDLVKLAARLQYTNYFGILLDELRAQDLKNKLSGHKEPLQLFIGNNKYPLNKLHADYIVDAVAEYIPGVKVSITPAGIETYNFELQKAIQHFSLYDLNTVIHDERFHRHIASSVYAGRVINTFPFIYDNKSNMSDDEVLKNTEAFMGMFFVFNFIRSKVKHE